MMKQCSCKHFMNTIETLIMEVEKEEMIQKKMMRMVILMDRELVANLNEINLFVKICLNQCFLVNEIK